MAKIHRPDLDALVGLWLPTGDGAGSMLTRSYRGLCATLNVKQNRALHSCVVDSSRLSKYHDTFASAVLQNPSQSSRLNSGDLIRSLGFTIAFPPSGVIVIAH